MKHALTPLHRRLPLLAAVAAVLVHAGCRSVPRFPGQWLDLPAPQGGRLEDFSRVITSHLFENGMMVGLGNDEDHLYVFFTPDMHRGRSLPGRARLAVWIDAGGGRARKLGLEHVSAPADQGRPPAPGAPGTDAVREKPVAAPGGPDKKDPRPASVPAQEFLKIIDRESGREAYVALDGSQGPALRLDNSWGEFTYQLRIPRRRAGDWPGLASRPGQAIAIGFFWEIEPQGPPGDREMKHPRGGPGGGPGGGGPGRGGPGMGGGPGGMPDAAPLRKRTAWVKTVLAAR